MRKQGATDINIISTDNWLNRHIYLDAHTGSYKYYSHHKGIDFTKNQLFNLYFDCDRYNYFRNNIIYSDNNLTQDGVIAKSHLILFIQDHEQEYINYILETYRTLYKINFSSLDGLKFVFYNNISGNLDQDDLQNKFTHFLCNYAYKNEYLTFAQDETFSPICFTRD